MSTFCGKEFEIENFGFHSKRPHIFVTSQFGPPNVYPVWTVVALIYHLIALAVDGYQTTDRSGETTANYFLYLPNWSYLLLTVYALYDCIITLYVHLAVPEMIERRDSNYSSIEVVMRNKVVNFDFRTLGELYTLTPLYLKVGWALFSLAIPVAFTVTLTFWTLYIIEDTDPTFITGLNSTKLKKATFDFGNLALTMINGIMAILHAWISAKPFKLLHFFFSMAFFGIYIFFTLIYQLSSGSYIYACVDWDDPFVTVSLVFGYLFFVVPFGYLVIFDIVYLRILFGTWFRLWRMKCKLIKQLPPEDPGHGTKDLSHDAVSITTTDRGSPFEEFMNDPFPQAKKKLSLAKRSSRVYPEKDESNADAENNADDIEDYSDSDGNTI